MAHIAVFTLDETVEWDLQSVLSIPFLMIAGPISGKKKGKIDSFSLVSDRNDRYKGD
jgi:hypothetical protein